VVNNLVKRGFAVDYAGVEKPAMVDPRVKTYRVQTPKTLGIPYELNLYRFHKSFAKLLRSRQINQYAFLYHRMSLSNYAAVLLSRDRRVPLVLEYNGSEVWAADKWGAPLRYQDVALKAEDTCLRHAHVLVTVSRVLRDELIARGVEPERIVCYPNCIDPLIFDPARFSKTDTFSLRRTLKICEGAVLVAFVGTFGPWHGAEVLAKAIRTLATQDTTWLQANRVHFLLVGDGLRMSAVRRILAEQECKDFYTLAGLVPQEESPSYMAAADILVSPQVNNPDGTRFFGSPTKLFEYMAMGKPIVASDLEQVGEVLNNSFAVADLPSHPPPEGDTHLGLLCSPGNESELIRGIRFLVENPRWREHFGHNCRREALRKYTWNHHVGAILERLDSLL
jgi:glycosyltransferase involved in cell wall biosynthesis